MKKNILTVICALFCVAAVAMDENIPTSKSYVDAAVETKQDIIPAADGAVRVLTNTGVAGEYETRGIYDAAGEYAAQKQNLVDAQTMNAAVQNATDFEFQCIEYDENNECLLMNINPVVRNTGIMPGDGTWCRAYMSSYTPSVWTYLNDPSSSIIMPIKPNVKYKLSWDTGYRNSIFRVAFVKENRCPTSGRPIALYAADGALGAELISNTIATPNYNFIVTDDTLKYLVVQIGGFNAPWENGDFTRLWDSISHLHIGIETWLDENKN